jgi:hypothetical protein
MLGFIASRLKYENVTARIRGKNFRLMKADTFIKRAIGLMYRDGIPKDGGMLFVLKEPSRQGIWMKNMRFPIDIIWVGGDMLVCDTLSSVKPCRDLDCKVYRPSRTARFVLELKAGSCRRLSIKPGSKVRLESV